MKKILTAAALLSLTVARPVGANQSVSPQQVRVATNTLLGTHFRDGVDTDTSRLSGFVAGTYPVAVDHQLGAVGAGATSITATFNDSGLTDVTIHGHAMSPDSHLHTPENIVQAHANLHNDTLIKRAMAAQGPSFEPISTLPLTSANFALALDWATRMASQPYHFVYATRGGATAQTVDLPNGVHMVTTDALNGTLTLSLGVSGGQIDTAAITHRGIHTAEAAAVTLTQQLVTTQSLSVDTISGATYTSRAVQNALASMGAGNHTRVNAPNVVTLNGASITAAQTAWRNAILGISDAYRSQGEFLMIAEATLNNLYAFDYGVLFADDTSLRQDRSAMLSFLIGDYSDSERQPQPGDGFGLRLYRDIRFETGHVVINGNQALWSGDVHFYNHLNVPTTVATTFGYTVGRDGAIRINLHHSHVVSVGEVSPI